MSENESKTEPRITLRLDQDTRERLKAEAERQGGRSVHSLIVEYVRRGLSEDEQVAARREAQP